jgi:hypothetical protein
MHRPVTLATGERWLNTTLRREGLVGEASIDSNSSACTDPARDAQSAIGAQDASIAYSHEMDNWGRESPAAGSCP